MDGSQDRRDDGRLLWRYLIYDCISVDGDEDIQKLNLLRRLQAAKKFVTEPLARLREVQQRQPAGSDAGRFEPPYPGTDFMDGALDFKPPGSAPRDPPMEIYLKVQRPARPRILFAVSGGLLILA